MPSAPLYWIWLSISLGYASHGLKPLLEKCGTPEEIFLADEGTLAEVKALCSAERRALLSKDLSRAKEILDYCEHGGIKVLAYEDVSYPPKLRDIENPPAVLYLRGKVPDWNRYPFISVVGTRSMDRYGADITFEIAYDLSRMGCVTVSGMALGIDGMVAASSLAAGGVTVAVLGSGIDRIYPREHGRLYRSIIENGGAVITEFAPYEGADGFHFPLRNRIISALGCALILVQGDVESGALITARCAKRQGKAVFAVPGKIGVRNSEAPLLLLKQNARPLTCADDIYDAFREQYFSDLNPFMLLTEATTNTDAVMRKYGVCVGRPKRERRSLLAEKEGEGLVGRIKGIFEKKPSLEEEKPSDYKEKERQNRIKTREQLDKVRMRALAGERRAVYEMLDFEVARHPDELSSDSLQPSNISAVLISLEIEGLVVLDGAGSYRKSEV